MLLNGRSSRLGSIRVFPIPVTVLIPEVLWKHRLVVIQTDKIRLKLTSIKLTPVEQAHVCDLIHLLIIFLNALLR